MTAKAVSPFASINMENSLPSISDIRYLITAISDNSGLNYEETVAVIEKVMESVLFNKYAIFFDENYRICAINKNDESDVEWINSVNDLKRIRQKILISVTEEKKEYIRELKSNISFWEIKNLISTEVNKYGNLALYRQVSYLLHKYIDGTVIAKIEKGYIININKINKAGYVSDAVCEYEVGDKCKFYVDKIKKDFSTGELKIMLKPMENQNTVNERSLIAKFRRSNGKFIKNKIAIIASKKFVRVYSVKNREVFYEKEFSDYNERTAAIITAASVFTGRRKFN